MENKNSWVSKVLLSLVLVLLSIAIYFFFKPTVTDLLNKVIDFVWNPAAEVTIWSEEDAQEVDEVTATAALAKDLTGSIYFDSLALAGEGVSEMATNAANLYRYDLDTDETITLVEFGESYDANPIDEKSVAFVTSLVADDSSNRSAHILLDTVTGEFVELTQSDEGRAYELAVSPQNTDLRAFVFRSDKATEEDLYDIKNYNIIFNNPYLGKTIVLDQSASPVWLAGDDSVIFLKQDGVYLYDLRTDKTKIIYDVYTDLSVLNHLAVSDSYGYVVMTLPSMQTIALLDIINADDGKIDRLEEGYVVTSDLAIYKTPVISPDGRFYAVVAANQTPGNPLHSIEIRHYIGHDVIKKIIPEGVDIQYLNLSAWRLEPLVALNTEDVAEAEE